MLKNLGLSLGAIVMIGAGYAASAPPEPPAPVVQTETPAAAAAGGAHGTPGVDTPMQVPVAPPDPTPQGG